jgi:hypothetical protein
MNENYDPFKTTGEDEESAEAVQASVLDAVETPKTDDKDNKAGGYKHIKEWPMTPTPPPPAIPGSLKPKELPETDRLKALRESLNEPLPGKLMDKIKLHGEYFLWMRGDNGFLPYDIRALISERQKALRIAINTETNPHKVVQIAANEMAIVSSAHKNRPTMRAQKIRRYSEALAKHESEPYFNSIPIVPKHSLPIYFKWLLGREPVREAVTMCRIELCRNELQRLKIFGVLYPSDRKEEIMQQLGWETNAASIQELQSELATLVLPSAKHAAHGAMRGLEQAWKKVEMFTKILLEWSLDELVKHQEGLIEAEKVLFINNAMGLEHSRTQVTTALDPAIKQFRDTLAAHSKPVHQMPGITPMDGENTVLQSMFGLSILGD